MQDQALPMMDRDTRLSDVLHVLLHMDQANEPLTSDVLARSMGTNPAVFRRTMAGLRKASLVRSERGHGGGWQLARPLSEITLDQIAPRYPVCASVHANR